MKTPTPLLFVLALIVFTGPFAGAATQQVQLPGQPARSAPTPVPLEVVGVQPALNALNVARTTAITMRFNLPVDPSSFQAPDFHVFGRWSTMRSGAISVGPGGRTVVFTPDAPFAAGENVTVTLSRWIRSASGQPLGKGFCWSFWSASLPGSGTYNHTQTLIPGDTPYGAWGGDVDLDGDLDLCTPNEHTLDVSVFLNDGSGTFSTAQSFGVGQNCSPNEAADFNFDGKVDLAVANIVDGDVSVLFGNGDGTFQPQVRFSVGSQPRGLTVVDANGDGYMDIVTANRVSNDLSLLMNDTLGSFLPEVRFEGGLNRETGVFASDMDRDGISDLVVIGYSDGRVSVLKGDGNAGFSLLSNRSIGSQPWMVVVGDLDGDGHNDVGAALAGAGSAGVCLNNGNGSLGSPSVNSVSTFPLAIDFGDLNGDGALDMGVCTYAGGWYHFFYNDGAGAMSSAFTFQANNAASCTVIHDLNGDGVMDITMLDELADLVFIHLQIP